MQLIVSSVEYSYPGSQEPVLSDVSVTFSDGWTGIVGDNGCGKTTLARIAARLIRPDVGSVNPPLVSACCPQSTEDIPDNLYDFAVAYDEGARRIRTLLGIGDEWPWCYGSLSGGQKKRVQIACTLWFRPDVLVIDEPTNHVDISTKEAICQALSQFKGIGLLISHDRELLDKLCGRCLFMSANSKPVIRPGGYTRGAEQALLEQNTARHARDAAKKEKRRLAQEAQRRRQESDRTDTRRSAAHLDKHDSSAREKIRMAIFSGKDKRVGKASVQMYDRLVKADEVLLATRVQKRYDGEIWSYVEPSRRSVLLTFPQQSLALGDACRLDVPDLYVGNTDHIGISGPNGAGKTTLVQALLAANDAKDDAQLNLTYLPQEPTDQQQEAALRRLFDLDQQDRGFVLSVIAQLNSEPERFLEGDAISPGEMRKLMLALGILDKSSIIVMDEPTNHLDLHSIEALEQMLAAFPAAFILVSHDEHLLKTACSIQWRIITKSEHEHVVTLR